MKKLKILFIAAPGLDLDNFDKAHNEIRGYELYPPIQLTMLAGSVVKKVENSESEVLDLEFEIRKYFRENPESSISAADFMKQSITKKMEEFKPDVAGISVVFSPAHKNTLAIANIVKEKNQDTCVVSGGNHATFAYKTLLEKCRSIDYVFLYEGDDTFPQFLEYLKGNIKFNDLRGIAWFDKETNTAKLAPYAPLVSNLDEIPIPKWDLVPINKYYKYGRVGAVQRYGDENLPSYTMQTVRGCAAACTFCSVRSFYGKGLRAFSAKRVLEEMDYLYNELGIKQLEILDDDFNYDKKRTLEICNGLIKRNYNLKWNMLNGIRLGTINDEILDALVSAKCLSISVGVESGNDSTLAMIKKPLSLKMLYKKAEMFQKYRQLYVSGYFMVGFPFETEEQMMNTYRVATEIGFDWKVFNVFRAIPGTPLFQKLDKKKQKDHTENQKDQFPLHMEARWRAEKKYKDEIEKQMQSAIQHGNNESKELSTGEEKYLIEGFDEANYIKNLEINFIKNPNLVGLSIDKDFKNPRGDYHININKKLNLDRAIKDFKGIINYIEKNHAVAHYCLAKAYSLKGDNNLAKYHLNEVSKILADPLLYKWNEYFEKILPQNEVSKLKVAVKKNKSKQEEQTLHY